MTLDNDALVAAFRVNHHPDAEPSSVELDKLSRSITAYLSALPAGEVGEIISALDQMALAWGQPDRAGVMLPFLGASTTDEAAKVATEAATALQTISAERDALSARCGEMERALTECALLSGLDNELIDGASVIVTSRMAEIHQHSSAAISRRATTGGEHG